MTIDVEKDLADVFKDEGASPPGAPDAPERPASAAGPASRAAAEAGATPGWRVGRRSTTSATAGR
jgi:hypothetical protein